MKYCCHRNELTYKVDDLNAQLRTAKEYVCSSVCLSVDVPIHLCNCICETGLMYLLFCISRNSIQTTDTCL